MTRKKKLTLVLLIVGIMLMACAVAGVVVSQLAMGNARSRNEAAVSRLYELMPQPYPGQMDDRINVAMPMLEVDGENYVGIIEVLKYDATLPVAAVWNQQTVSKYPCRYTGSIYDGSLIIGGSDNDGQFDFMKLITTGDVVYVTDVTGARYGYEVTEVEKTEDVSTEKLSGEDDDLVFFARNTYSLDYTVVRCQFGTK